MRPADDPRFFDLPAPTGQTRESTLRIDANGKFWHQGEKIENLRMQRAFFEWVDIHPNGRFILNNGYDWVYVSVDDAPLFVERITSKAHGAVLELSDGSTQELDAADMFIAQNEVVYVRVRAGRLTAKFSREAQLMLEPWLRELDSGELALEVGGQSVELARLTVSR